MRPIPALSPTTCTLPACFATASSCSATVEAIATGTPRDELTSDLIRDVYGAEAEMTTTDRSDGASVVFTKGARERIMSVRQ